MIERERFTWDCVLIEEGASSSTNVDREFSSFWSPAFFEGRTFEVAEACAAEETFLAKRKGRQKMYRPVSATLRAAA